MSRTQAVDPNNASREAQPLLEQGRKQAGGQDINFFKQMAAAPTALKGYMDFAGTLQGGALDRRTQEAIAVGVSDFNGCKYWLSVHSAAAEQAGLDAEDRKRAQTFEAEDPKLAAALELAREVVENRGRPSDSTFEEARIAGHSDEELIEIVANVALTTFSNYLNDTVETEVDVPAVEPMRRRPVHSE